jgi:hypothetical protein
MKKGDVGTDLIFVVKDKDGAIVDLTGAMSAKLRIKINDNTVVEKDMTFVDRPNGKVKYKVETGILSEPGDLQMEVMITFDANNIFRCDTVMEEIKRDLI